MRDLLFYCEIEDLYFINEFRDYQRETVELCVNKYRDGVMG